MNGFHKASDNIRFNFFLYQSLNAHSYIKKDSPVTNEKIPESKKHGEGNKEELYPSNLQ